MTATWTLRGRRPDEGRLLRGTPDCAVFGALAGVVLFFLVFDPRLLDPGYFAWLLDGDPATEYLGWRFFRAEAWQWPPGALRSYGLEVGSAIPYSDSIPLAALAGKLFRGLLPDPFQYFGIWMLASFALQGFFGGLLASLASTRALERYAITLLFVASVPLLDRAIGHYALMSHWIVLWGLWLALRPHRELATAQWTALLCLASLVHAYLLALAIALWIADVVRRRHFDPPPRPGFGVAFRHVTIVAIALLATMALAGYFVIPGRSMSGGAMYFGKYAANLNAFWNPGWGSAFLPNLPVMKGSELEGHGYLGLGVLLMLVAAALALVAPGTPRVNVRPYVPLIAVAAALWAISLSHQIAWGDRVVVELPIRGRLLDLFATLRASGRLIWVAMYGLTFAAAAIVAARFAPRAATMLIVAAVALQLVDLAPRFGAMRGYFENRFFAVPAKRTTPLASPFWAEAAKHYRTIRMAPAASNARGWEWLSLYAVDHGMAINTGQFARLPHARIGEANRRLTAALAAGELDPGTIYLMWSPDARFDWQIGPDDGVGTIDGYVVIAPRWFAEPRGSLATDHLVRGPKRGIAP